MLNAEEVDEESDELSLESLESFPLEDKSLRELSDESELASGEFHFLLLVCPFFLSRRLKANPI